jgi:hypothetical protein
MPRKKPPPTKRAAEQADFKSWLADAVAALQREHNVNPARTLLAQERVNVGAIAEETGLSRQTVYRIKDYPAAAEAALTAWGL